jgi:hypothetical protein
MALDKLKTFLLPKEEIVGIEITDNCLKFIGFSGTPNKNWVDFNVNLPEGVIVNGNLIKPDILSGILSKTKKAYFQKKKEKVYAIISLNTNLFYTNVLSLPNISSSKELKEAIELNTSLVSPIKLEDAYFDFEDWTHPGEVNKKIFIVLTPKTKIDPYLKCFKNSNFELLALEFGLLGLNRLVCNYASTQPSNFLILNFRSEGVNMAIGSSDGSLILPTSEAWNDILKDLGAQNITVDTLKKYLGLEIPKLISYLASHYNQALEGFYVLSNNNVFNQETSQFLISDFGLKPLTLNLPNSLLKRSADDYIVIGTALRGLIGRENDTIVSLMPIGTEQKYQETRNYNYISFWVKSISITILFIVAIFAGVNFGLFQPTFQNISRNNLNLIISPEQQRGMSLLVKDADDFNRNLGLMMTLAQKRYDWNTVLEALGENQETTLQNIKMIDSGTDKSVTATFISKTRETALLFRDKIKGLSFVDSLEMPAKLFTEQPDKQLVQFDLIIKLK